MEKRYGLGADWRIDKFYAADIARCAVMYVIIDNKNRLTKRLKQVLLKKIVQRLTHL